MNRLPAAPATERQRRVGAIALASAWTASLLVPTHWLGIPAKALLTLLLSVLALVLATRTRPLRPGRSDVGFHLTLLAGLLSLGYAKNYDAACVALAIPLAMLCAHRAARSLCDAPERWLTLYGALSVIVAACGLAGYRDMLHSPSADAPAARATFLATPFFDHSYLAVQAIAPLIPLALLYALSPAKRLRRVLAAAAALVVLSFVMVSLSRATVLAVAVGTTLAGLRALPLRTNGLEAPPVLSLRWRAVLVVAALALSIVLGKLMFARFTSFVDPALAVFNFMRVLIWQDTLAMISSHLPLGVGIGHFGFEFGAFHAATRPVAHGHDQWLHSLAETGVVGLIGVVLLFLTPWFDRRVRERVAARRGDPPLQRARHAAIACGLLGAVVTWFVIAWFESPLAFMGSALPFAIVTGMLIGPDPPPEAASVESRARAHTSQRTLTLAVLGITLFTLPALLRVARSGWLGNQAQAALIAGDTTRCAERVAEALAITDALPELFTLQARAALARGDYATAARALTEHEARVPGLPDHLVDFATTQRELGVPERAIEPLQRAIRRARAEAVPGIRVELLNMLSQSARFEEARLEAIELISNGVHLKEPIVLLRLAESLANLRRERATAVAVLDQYLVSIAPETSTYARELRAGLLENSMSVPQQTTGERSSTR